MVFLVISTTDPPIAFDPGHRFFLAFGSLCVIALMAALDATSLSASLSKMASQFQGTAIEAFWGGTPFLPTSTVFQPVIGSFSGVFGRKTLVFISLCFFGVGAIIAALAKANDGMAMILIGRCIRGVGGGGIIVLIEIIATDLVPLLLRGRYQSFIGAMWALGSVGGPLIGGVFAEDVTWCWIFWINLSFIGVGAVMIAPFLKLLPLKGSFSARLARIDWIGCVLFVGSSAVRGYTPIISGVALFPQTFTVAPAAIVVGLLVTRSGRYRWTIWVGWFLTTLGAGPQTLLDVNTSIPSWILLNLVPGLGIGMLFPAPMVGLQAATPAKDIPAAVSLFTFFRAFGQTMGVAIGGVISQNRVKKQILSHPLIAARVSEWAADASALVDIVNAMPNRRAREQLVRSHADALKIVWAVTCGVAFFGLVTSALTRHTSLDRPLETNQEFIHVEKAVDDDK